ncbi:MAG: FKBP-type peptidyl-prolyl cis-trans isomerase [Muribaculaceae bacterium]|nr:FKBP-type peptidyl-prolyl cis-trans isomerase [Muribaculaceae bacterium]
MKKVLTAIFASAMVLAASCSGDKNNNDANYSAEEKAAGDSLSTAFGHMQGAQALSNYKRIEPMMTEQQRNDFKKDEFIKGLELVLTTDTANLAYLNGIQQGLQMYGIFMDKNLGVPVDAKAIVAAFAEVYNTDSLTTEMSVKYQSEFEEILGNIQARAEAKAEAEARETPEAKENIAAGEKYISDRMAEGFQKTASGVAYKIITPGDSTKVKESDVIKMKYVGKHVNGEEFDRTPGDNSTRSAVANLVPGFRDGLYLLGKGGSAIIVIPGDLAYGAKGRGPIAPMETLVFEVTVEDIE